jgi:hypothetical protein
MERAVFFDGRSSRRRNVTLTFANCLVIGDSEASSDTPLAFWPYDTVRRVDGPEDVLRLACTTAPPLARLELREAAARANMLRLCAAIDGPGSAAIVSAWRIAAASLAAAAAILGMVWFGMPVLANRLVAITPYSWEKPLGDAVDPRVRAIFGTACEKPDGVAALHKLVGQLQATRHAGSGGAAVDGTKRLRATRRPGLRVVRAARQIPKPGRPCRRSGA